MPCVPQGRRERPALVHGCPFGDDASAIRLRNAALNLSSRHRLALKLFLEDKFRSSSLPRRKAAAWNPDHLATDLPLREI